MASTSISGGAGIHSGSFYVDAAYVHTNSKEFFQPYTLASGDVPGVGINKNTGNIVMTLGWKF